MDLAHPGSVEIRSRQHRHLLRIGIAHDFALVLGRDAQVDERAVAVVDHLMWMLGTNGVRDPVAGPHGDPLLAEADAPVARDYVDRLFVGAVIVERKRALARTELEQLAAEL